MYSLTAAALRGLAGALSLLAVLTAPAAAQTSPVLDQEQTIVTGGLSVRAAAAPSQTITTGLAGLVVRVDLVLCSPVKNADVIVDISSTGSNLQTATTSMKFKHSYSDCAWYTFTFSQPISVAAGEVLRLDVKTKNHKVVLWGDDGRPGRAYPRGVATWKGHAINAFAFRTYTQ